MRGEVDPLAGSPYSARKMRSGNRLTAETADEGAAVLRQGEASEALDLIGRLAGSLGEHGDEALVGLERDHRSEVRSRSRSRRPCPSHL